MDEDIFSEVSPSWTESIGIDPSQHDIDHSEHYTVTETPDGKLTFHCHFCQKTFGDKWKIHHHVMIHTGHKPFQCLQCSHKTIRKSDLKKHIYNKHLKNETIEFQSMKKRKK
ncbi:hypothetical protein ACF0H5_022571 [Mactra antiquata]